MADYAKHDWKLKYDLQVPTRPNESGQGWHVNFPGPAGVLGYAICDTREIIGGGRRPSNRVSIVVDITTSPGATFDHQTESHNTGTAPSAVRIMLMKSMRGEFNRWWSNSGITLADGTFSLTVPLNPALWTSVLGKRGNHSAKVKRAFNNFLSTPVHPCLTFGGGNYYGHGTRLSSGTGTFRLKKYLS